MNKETNRVMRMTGFALIVAGILLAAQALFMYLAQSPPRDVTALQLWLDSGKQSLMMANELLFFAAVAIATTLVGLYRLLVKNAPVLTVFGCSLLGIATTLLFVLCIIQGRMVYPVFGQVLTGENMILVTSLFYGGLHTVYLLLAGASLALGAAMSRSGYGSYAKYIGTFSAVAAIVAAYPWAITSSAMLVAQIVVTLWFVYMGTRMMSATRAQHS